MPYLEKIFSLMSFGDVTKVALWINFLSAAVRHCRVVLFLDIYIFCTPVFGAEGDDLSTSDKLKVFGAGVVAALSCTFLDSLWFSAVERGICPRDVLYDYHHLGSYAMVSRGRTAC